jgi:hypothetical protein
MNEWVRRSLSAGALTAGAVMATGVAAHADTTMVSDDNVGILNGTQVNAPIQAPINLCGVAAAVAGHAVAGCEGGSAASIKDLYDVKMISTDNVGILNGTQVFLPVQIPVNVCGVAVAALGAASAHCEGGASAKAGSDRGRHHHKPKPKKPKESTAREESGGNEEGKPCSGCPTTPPTTPPKPEPPAQECPPKHHHHHHHHHHHTMLTKNNVGVLNGTQVYAPIQAPVNVSSISAAVAGNAWSWSDGGSSARM